MGYKFRWAQLDPLFRAHKAEIEMLDGVISYLKTLGEESASKSIQIVGRIPFFMVPGMRWSVSLLAWAMSLSFPRGCWPS